MRLKTLELFGFKSFADRTTFHFDKGTTAIVGPNGCGKSNVVDSVKWVLGEQSVRSLRGREMLDVVFNGSDRRPPANFAEVTLCFENEDRTLPMDFDEVAVTRRLYRSGDSEYLINRQPRRLRDIRELFMGTGLGPGGYAFMEQGKIDSLLASNPVDRRRVFEEAAGISLYASRRHETEMKLDKLDANLLRLADIVEELERQQRSLKIQAGKAERYQEFTGRVQELQVQVALHRFDVNARKLEEIDTRLEALRAERAATLERRDELKSDLAAAEASFSSASEELAGLRERHAAASANDKASRDLVAMLEQQIEVLERRSAGRTGDIADLERDVASSLAEQSHVAAEAAGLETELRSLREALELREAEARTAQETLATTERSLQDTESRSQDLTRRQVDINRRLAGMESDLRRWQDERQRATSRLESLRAERKTLAERFEETRVRHARLDEDLLAQRGALRNHETEVEKLDSETQVSAERHRQLLAENSRVTGRVDAIEGVINRHEGLDAGVKAVLEERRRRPDFLPGFKGLVLDHLRADLGVAEAIEAGLGDVSQAIVVADIREAIEAARWLAQSGKGRACFVAADSFASSGASLPAGVRTTNDVTARIVAEILDGVTILPADAVTEALSKGQGLSRLVVSADGCVIRDARVVHSGKRTGRQGLLAMRSELDELKRRQEDVRRELATVESSLEDLQRRRSAAREEVKRRAAALSAGQGEWNRLDHEFRGLEQKLQRLDEEERRQGELQTTSETRLDEVGQAKALTSAQQSELEGEMSLFGNERQSLAEIVRELRSRRDESFAAREGARVAVASGEQRRNGLINSDRHLRERHEKALRAIEKAREELTIFTGEREASASSLANERTRVEALSAELLGLKQKLDEASKSAAEVRSALEEKQKADLEIQEKLDELNGAVHSAEVRHSELRVNQENLVEIAAADMQIDLVQVHHEFTPKEDVDWRAVEGELAEMKDKIKKLGNINLAAIDDLHEVEERLQFLVAQRADLVASKQQLAKVLGDIEAESTRLFVATFERVKAEFQETFRRLFSGGRADIALIDEQNPLESGIEIVARPPGKKMQSISLLSGGERTMTAVALLFSIIRAHPVPCCLLDEVDAALDEDNTERFSMLLSEFLGATQFILITHSRRTMAKAAALFGVTMAERGVSRHVAVRFEEVKEDGSFEIRTTSSRPSTPEEVAATATATATGRQRRRIQPAAGQVLEGRMAPSDTASSVESEADAGSDDDHGSNGANGSAKAASGGTEVLLDLAAAADDAPERGRPESGAAPSAELTREV